MENLFICIFIKFRGREITLVYLHFQFYVIIKINKIFIKQHQCSRFVTATLLIQRGHPQRQIN